MSYLWQAIFRRRTDKSRATLVRIPEREANLITIIKELQNKGYTIIAIVSDGRKGLVQSFDNIPVQMCQFHQVAIIRRYITKNP